MHKGFIPARHGQPLFRGGLIIISFLIAGHLTAGEPNRSPTVVAANNPRPPASESGIASYYADKHHGQLTANGETFDMNALTAAHKTLPFGTKLKVTSLANNRSVMVRVNDRGPFVKGRIIDLSLGAAKELQMVQSGLAEVKLEIIK